MKNDGLYWVDGWPVEKSNGLPSGRIFFDPTNAILNRNKNTQFGCRGKVQYDSRDAALKEIYRLMKESLSNTTFLRTYKCKYCKKWHFTSKES